MAEQNSATPESATGPNLQKVAAPKDKNCRYCGQAFTSSSLGRHLDLYIKAKHPKPPDGIHKIDEIRKLRGNVTRRHARASKKHGRSSTSSGTTTSPPAETVNTVVPTVAEDRSMSNVMEWQASESMDAASRDETGNSTTDSPRHTSLQEQLSIEAGKRQKISEEWEYLKAAELALKEVLRGIKDANAQSTGLGLFNFNPFELNFPSLCLHILPAPSTLFSPTPFATADSWSISPPGQKQFEALIRNVRERIPASQVNHFAHTQSHGQSAESPSAASQTPTPSSTLPLTDLASHKVFVHFKDAFAHWRSLTDKERHETWQLEILRSFVRADTQCKKTKREFANVRRQLEARTSQIGNGVGLSGAVSSETSPFILEPDPDKALNCTNVVLNTRDWDHDSLITKWCGLIRENLVSSGLNSQRNVSAPRSASLSVQSTLGRHGANGIPVAHEQPSESGGNTTLTNPESAGTMASSNPESHQDITPQVNGMADARSPQKSTSLASVQSPPDDRYMDSMDPEEDAAAGVDERETTAPRDAAVEDGEERFVARTVSSNAYGQRLHFPQESSERPRASYWAPNPTIPSNDPLSGDFEQFSSSRELAGSRGHMLSFAAQEGSTQHLHSHRNIHPVGIATMELAGAMPREIIDSHKGGSW